MWKQARIDVSNTDDEFTNEDKTVKLMESDDSGNFGVLVGNGGRAGTLESEHESKEDAVVAFERKARKLAVKHNDTSY